MVLWLLILRAISIEFRSHLESPIWRPLWDTIFSLSSLLLAVFLGAALGNVVRGVPLNADGFFFTPLWTSFGIGGDEVGILDWFTVTVGVTSLLALTYHGAQWIILKTEDDIRERAKKAAGLVWPLLILFVGLVTVMTFAIQPHVPEHMNAAPASYLLPVLAAAGIFGSRMFMAQGKELAAFLGSAVFLVFMLVSVVFGLYPLVLPATGDPSLSLTIYNASGPPYAMWVALFWWIPGMILVSIYTTFVYRQMRGKVKMDPDAY